MWQIRVAEGARPALRALDASLREELIARVDSLAEAPIQFLTRAQQPSWLEGTWVYSYGSEVVLGLHIYLYFGGFNDDPPRLELLAIGEVMA